MIKLACVFFFKVHEMGIPFQIFETLLQGSMLSTKSWEGTPSKQRPNGTNQSSPFGGAAAAEPPHNATITHRPQAVSRGAAATTSKMTTSGDSPNWPREVPKRTVTTPVLVASHDVVRTPPAPINPAAFFT